MSIPNDNKITLKYEDGLSLAWQMTLIKTFMRLFLENSRMTLECEFKQARKITFSV